MTVKKLRSFIAFLLCLAVCAGLIPCFAFASGSDTVPDQKLSPEYLKNASGECGKKLAWILDPDGVLFIKGTGDMDAYGIESIGGQWRTTAPWCDFSSSIKRVIVDNGVTSIGDFAFAYCGKITGITLPDSLTAVGCGAFSNCTSLTSAVIPTEVELIPDWMFEGCTALDNVGINSKVKCIGTSAFMGCSSLTSVLFSDSGELWDKITVGSGNERLYYADVKFFYPVHSKTIDSGEYYIYSRLGGRPCLIIGPDGRACISYSKKQAITVTYLDNGFYSIGDLAVDTDCAAPSAKLKAGMNRDSELKEWTIIPNGASYLIKCRSSDLYIDVENASLNGETGVSLFYRNPGYYAQDWYLEPVSDDSVSK